MSANSMLDSTVGQLVAEQPARSRVFERFGIDYCCGGKKSLAAACTEKGLSAELIVREIAQLDESTPPPEVDWNHAPLSHLCDHIERTHHDGLRVALPRLTMLTEKAAAAHGDRDRRLHDLRDLFASFRAELEAHMAKEELILFPHIRKMEASGMPQAFHCGPVANPIRVMLAEHDDAGEALSAMRILTDNFTAPSNACNTYRALIEALTALETDMHQHVHKENSILFPRAEELEASCMRHDRKDGFPTEDRSN